MTTSFFFINTGPAILVDEEKSQFKLNKLLNNFFLQNYSELEKFDIKKLESDLWKVDTSKRIYRCNNIYKKDNEIIKEIYYIDSEEIKYKKYDVVMFNTTLDVNCKMNTINNFISLLDWNLLKKDESLFKIKEDYKKYIDGTDDFIIKERVMKYSDTYRLKIKPKFVRTFLTEVKEIINDKYICSVDNRNDITSNIFLIESSKVYELFNYFEKLYEYKFDIEE